MHVSRIDIYEVDIPFKLKFSHALKERVSSESIFVKLTLDNGVAGYGEGLPRQYVTGETVSSAVASIREDLGPLLMQANFIDDRAAFMFMYDLGNRYGGAAKCAVELALLDAVSRSANKSVVDFIGGFKRLKVHYTGVITSGDKSKIIKYGLMYKFGGFKYVKLKVGKPEDIENIRILRKILGDKVDIRVDVNCAWDRDQAARMIKQMKVYGINAVEQPLAANDIEGMKQLTSDAGVYISADESLVTLADAEKLAKEKACSMFNIRISKCGGLINAIRTYEIAAEKGIKCQLGCQVGESSILSAAGRHLAMMLDDVDYIEGSYGKFLLKKDIVKRPVVFGYAGCGKPICGNGLGVVVDEAMLNSLSRRRHTV